MSGVVGLRGAQGGRDRLLSWIAYFVLVCAWGAVGVVGLAAAETQAANPEDRALLRVELNSASVDELCLLPGIGPKKAAAIVAYRERRPFTRVTQLLRVRGIGRKTLRRLKPFVFVAPRTLQGSAPKASPVKRGAVSRGPGKTKPIGRERARGEAVSLPGRLHSR